jgi:hypothetical protein
MTPKEHEFLKALELVSELLAKWSLNDGPLDYKNISNDEARELQHLEVVLENAIVSANGKW